MSSSIALREIFAAARPLVEEWIDIGEQIAALRDVATAKGLDWSQVKALLKAQIQDERDETGGGKRVRRLVEKAEFASAYADMLGLAKMNENIFSSDQPHSSPTSSPETNTTGAVARPTPAAPVNNSAGPRLSGVPGGERSNPSPSDGRAKMDEVTPHPDRSGEKPAYDEAQEGQAANISDEGIPAFLRSA